MTPQIYVFGNPNNTFQTYPQNHVYDIVKSGLSKVKANTQIILRRKDNLLYYCYLRKISSNRYFGICACYDRIILDFDVLFDLFDNSYQTLVIKGEILVMTKEQQVKYIVQNLNTDAVAVNELSMSLIDSINKLKSNPLPPADFSISINEWIDLSLETDLNLIPDKAKHYANLYIVKTHDEVAKLTEVAVLLKNQSNEIDALKSENNRLQRIKKRTSLVVFLLLVIIAIGVIFYFYSANKSEEIADLKDDLENAEKERDSLEDDLFVLNDKYDALNDKYVKLDNYISKVPFVITDIKIANVYSGGGIETDYGNTLYSTYSMFLKPQIYYYAPKKSSGSLQIIWYNSDGEMRRGGSSPSNCTFTDDYIAYKGSGSFVVSGWGNENMGHWHAGKYSLEIWYGDICLGVKHITLY